MAKIAVIVLRNFEDGDYTALTRWLQGAGHEIVHVGEAEAGEVVTGRKGHGRVSIDRSVWDADVAHLDGVIVPSGYTPGHLMRHENILNLVRDAYATGKVVGAISSAGWLVVEPAHSSESLISWPTVKRDLLNVVADWKNADVVAHDNVRLSRSPGDLDGFARAFHAGIVGEAHELQEPAFKPEEELSPVERVYGPEPAEPHHG